ncbi:MAG: carboxypeptidase regulatory-like domain-containing protein [Bryobacteraceae bacterium]|nr:carboxypeptidase regulatory-like domain-containing protein [Bryobacteraceae bacterium]
MMHTIRLFSLFLLLTPALLSQEYSAALSVTVVDPSESAVPKARLLLTDKRWGAVLQSETGVTGIGAFNSLRPGEYSLEVIKDGFDRVRQETVVLAVRDRQSVRIVLQITQTQTSVEVKAEGQGVTTDASLGINVDQNFLQHLPLNGRNPNALILMTPGITSSAGTPGGGFNANGLRSNTNYYTLDGVNVNMPVGGGGPGPGGPRGAGGPAPQAPSGAADIISLDALQEVRVQTSPFAPEFGRSPGAQISMTSRGGSDQFHGSLFHYLRNESLNANEWFANSSGLPRERTRQYWPGGALGGPLLPGRTFFFGSYEHLRLDAPSTLVSSVPDLRLRRSAAASLRPFLNAFPLPNGAALADGAAEFRATTANPSRSHSGSLRLDHIWSSKMTLFARYSLAPQTSTFRGSQLLSPNMLVHRSTRNHTLTLGGARASSPTRVHDFRLNVSHSSQNGFSLMDDFGGAVPLSDARAFPDGVTSNTGSMSLTVLGLGGYSHGGFSRNSQRQWNAVYSWTASSSAHTTKIGFDYRRISLTLHPVPYSVAYTFSGLTGSDGTLSSGVATNSQVSASVAAVYPTYTNLSAYAQDTYRATERTTLTYGLRWDLNPAPGARQGPDPLVLSNGELTQDKPLYRTRWLDIAPRFGLAYQMDTTPGREMMFRAGVGLFYDLGYGITAGAFNGAPYSNDRTLSSATFPLTRSDALPPVLPPEPPYGQIVGADGNLRSPVIYQWSAVVERYFASSQVLSVGYSGSRGRRLMRMEMSPSFSSEYEIARLATNGAASDYHGLQVQLRRRFTSNLQTQLSYTWSHSIDSSSNDLGFTGFASLFNAGQRGPSDYDIRHSLSYSGTYKLYDPRRTFLGAVLGRWFLDWVASYRTGLPFDIQGVTSDTSSDTDDRSGTPRNFRGGLFAQVRPNYTGAPIWIRDDRVPGGRRLNRDAFAAPSGYAQGNLGRNALRGLGFFQADVSLRRQFTLSDRLRLNLSAQAFNILNRASFANPSPLEGANLSSPNFGILTRTLNQSPGGGSSPYQSGGPRSLELALRLQF